MIFILGPSPGIACSYHFCDGNGSSGGGGSFVLLIGDKIRPQTANAERQSKGDRIKFGREGEGVPDPEYSQAALKLSSDSLFLSAKTGDIASASVTMRNVGTVAIYFCWKKQPEDPLVNASQAWNDANFQVPRRERFTVLESSGRILSGQEKKFQFSFVSKFAGSFCETWHLWTSPVLPDPPAPLFLKATATTEDMNGGLREKLVRELQHREMVRGVQEVVEELLDTSSDLTCTTLKARPEYLYSSAAYEFLRQNLGSEPPLYHRSTVESQCQELAAAINSIIIQEAEDRKPPVEDLPPPTIQWDGSLANLVRSTEGITSQESRNRILEVFPEIKDAVEIPPHASSTFHLAMYKIFSGAIHPVYDAIEKTLADIAAKAQAEAEARVEARRKKAEEDGLDPDMVENEDAGDEPQIGEDGEEIPPAKLYDCVPVFSAVKDVLMDCFLQVEDGIEVLEDKAICVIESRVGALKMAKEANEQNLWDIFALEREKLFLVLGKDRDFDF